MKKPAVISGIKSILRGAVARILNLVMKPAARYPADPRAVFVLGLCTLAGIPLVFADAAPGTIESQLDHWMVVVWGVSLALGSLACMLGMFRQTVNGILFEQVGSVCVGASAVFYGATVLVVVGWSASFPAAITIGWGLSCFWRWGQLQTLLNDAERIVQEAKLQEATAALQGCEDESDPWASVERPQDIPHNHDPEAGQ